MAIRLADKGLEIPANLLSDWTIRLYRNSFENLVWEEMVLRSDGNLYVEGKLNQDYSKDWVEVDSQGKLTIKAQSGDIEELLILPYLVDENTIETWSRRKVYFYEDKEEISYDPPTEVIMKVGEINEEEN